MSGAEKIVAVALRGIGEQTLEEKLIDEAGGSRSHCGRVLHERAEVIVDDHLTGQAESLCVGFEFVPGLFFGQTAVLDFTVRAERQKVADVRHAETLGFLEVVEVAGGAEAGGDDGLRGKRLEQLLVGSVREDAGERDGRERSADAVIVETATDALSFEAAAFHGQFTQGNVAHLACGFDGLLAVGFQDDIIADAGAERQSRFKHLRIGLIVLDDDVRR